MRENVYIGHVQKSQIGGSFHCTILKCMNINAHLDMCIINRLIYFLGLL